MSVRRAFVVGAVAGVFVAAFFAPGFITTYWFTSHWTTWPWAFIPIWLCPFYLSEYFVRSIGVVISVAIIGNGALYGAVAVLSLLLYRSIRWVGEVVTR